MRIQMKIHHNGRRRFRHDKKMLDDGVYGTLRCVRNRFLTQNTIPVSPTRFRFQGATGHHVFRRVKLFFHLTISSTSLYLST